MNGFFCKEYIIQLLMTSVYHFIAVSVVKATASFAILRETTPTWEANFVSATIFPILHEIQGERNNFSL